jgi:hypothetical protein
MLPSYEGEGRELAYGKDTLETKKSMRHAAHAGSASRMQE